MTIGTTDLKNILRKENKFSLVSNFSEKCFYNLKYEEIETIDKVI